MKKWLMFAGLLFGLSTLSYSGTPVESYYSGQAGLSNTSIYGSSSTVNNIALPVVPPACASGQVARNCFNKIQLGLTVGASYYALDGGTTVQFLVGGQIGSSGGIHTFTDEHLGPLCLTSGQTTTFKVTGAAPPSNFINYEGFTNCGGTDNAGVMK